MNVSEGNQISGLPYFQTNPHKGLLIIIGHLRCFCLRRFIQRYCKNQPIWICVISYIYIVYTYKNIHIYIYQHIPRGGVVSLLTFVYGKVEQRVDLEFTPEACPSSVADWEVNYSGQIISNQSPSPPTT